MYDVTCRESFDKLDSWRNELDTYATQPNIVRMLVGNKVDKESERQVPKVEAIDYAERHYMLFVETSARTSENTVRCFEDLVAKVRRETIKNLFKKTRSVRMRLKIDISFIMWYVLSYSFQILRTPGLCEQQSTGGFHPKAGDDKSSTSSCCPCWVRWWTNGWLFAFAIFVDDLRPNTRAGPLQRRHRCELPLLLTGYSCKSYTFLVTYSEPSVEASHVRLMWKGHIMFIKYMYISGGKLNSWHFVVVIVEYIAN